MKNIMETFNSLQMASILVIFLIISAIPVNSQLSTPCTISMVSSFTPCINYITGSSNNGTSPTTSCCNTLKALMNVSVDCACLVLTANVPFQLPINQIIALFLPQACNLGGLPIACKASASPLPAPGSSSVALSPSKASPSLSPRASASPPPAPGPSSVALSPLPASPSLSPRASASPPPAPGPSSVALSPLPASPSLSPRASKALAATQAPNSEATPQLTPTFPPLESQLPAAHRIQPVLTPPSSSPHRFFVSPSYFFVIFAAIMGFYPH